MKESNAKIFIGIVTIVVLSLVGYMYLSDGFVEEFNASNPNFNKFILPKFNAIFNSLVSVFLILSLYFIKKNDIKSHKFFNLLAALFSLLFLLNYVFYHMIAEQVKYQGSGVLKYIYLFILSTHIILAATTFPFILLTFYRGLTMQVEKHKKIAKIIYPLWLYVAVTGVIIYLMISPYYPV